MSKVRLTQMQYEVLEAATWGDDNAENIHRLEIGPRRATLQQVERSLKQLQKKGFVHISKRGVVRPTGLGEVALTVVEAQCDLDEAQGKFDRRLRRASK